MPDLTGNTQYDAITAAIREFSWDNYGLDDVDPENEFAEWVPALAGAIHQAVSPGAVRDPQVLARFRDEEGGVWLLLLDEEEGPRLAREEDRQNEDAWLSWHMVTTDADLTRI